MGDALGEIFLILLCMFSASGIAYFVGLNNAYKEHRKDYEGLLKLYIELEKENTKLRGRSV